MRNLEKTDYERYVRLTGSGISRDQFDTFIAGVLDESHIIVVIEDSLGNITGAGTLLIEEKLTHGGCKMGHIENVLIDDEHRGRGHGERLVGYLLDLAKTNGCYRVDLNCQSELESFYERNGFSKNSISMNVYIKENFER